MGLFRAISVIWAPQRLRKVCGKFWKRGNAKAGGGWAGLGRQAPNTSSVDSSFWLKNSRCSSCSTATKPFLHTHCWALSPSTRKDSGGQASPTTTGTSQPSSPAELTEFPCTTTTPCVFPLPSSMGQTSWLSGSAEEWLQGLVGSAVRVTWRTAAKCKSGKPS